MQTHSDVESLTELLQRAAQSHPDKPALVDNHSSITFGKLMERAGNLAFALQRLGCRPGERVACMMEKRNEAVVAFLACAMSGIVFFPVDYNQTRPHLQFIFDLTRPSALIVQKKFLLQLAGLHVHCGGDRTIIHYSATDSRAGQDDLRWDQIVRTPPEAGWCPVVTGPDDPVYLNFTSGTTGTPKAAVTTNANLYWNTRAAIEAFGLREDDVHLSMFPIFGHPHELFMRGLMLGGTSVLVDGIAPRTVMESLERNNVTCMMAVASIYQSLLKYVQISDKKLEFLRVAESGGMFVTEDLARSFSSAMGIPISPVWGSTEACGIALVNHGHTSDGPLPGATGRPAPHYEVKLVDDDGETIDEPGVVGQMCVKGPGVCGCYFGSPEETAKQFRDGWFYSGDLFKRDADGFYYFSGRASRLIKVAGLKVYPTELEDVISKHPEVAEVAVVRAADRRHGEVPRAVVVPVAGSEVTAEELRRYCAELLEHFKVPRIFEFREALPKNPVGKVLYRVLEETENCEIGQ
jgi:long-chain acyl-CoA synthetase